MGNRLCMGWNVRWGTQRENHLETPITAEFGLVWGTMGRAGLGRPTTKGRGHRRLDVSHIERTGHRDGI